ncbi:MAG: hypothetical protein ACRELE_06805, partial [Gemmatimonadales bacterium]
MGAIGNEKPPRNLDTLCGQLVELVEEGLRIEYFAFADVDLRATVVVEGLNFFFDLVTFANLIVVDGFGAE